MKHSLAFLLLCLACACKNGETEVVKNQATGGVFGTSYSIIYLTVEPLDYQHQIDSVFNAVNQSLSTYIPESDISKINLGDTTLRVDHMFKDVFMLSREIYDKTNGYFDPTVGTLVNAWGFGPGEEMPMDSLKVDSLLQYVGFNKVALTSKGTIVKEHAAIYFDFNAIAKGYAIDRVAVLLDSKNVNNYLIEIGGEVVGKGSNLIKDKPWAVGIDNPQNGLQRETKTAIYLKDRALASSGNYRKFRVDEASGEKFVHTIDPITGYTRNSNTLGVTVLAGNCAKADGYATALMAMDLDAAKKLVESDASLDAYIIYADPEGIVQEFMTEGFRKLMLK